MSTVHDHDVPYYEIVDLTDGRKQHVRKTRVQSGVRHALAFHLQTEYCPHTPECGAAGQPLAYYTTVDVLAIDGDFHVSHEWDRATPFPGFANARAAIDVLYLGDRHGQGFRYYRNRRSVSFTLGFHTNHTRSCEPTLHDRVNVGVYCSWTPQANVELDEKQCRYSLTAHLLPDRVYDGFEATYPMAPAGELGHDDHAPLYVREESDATTQPDPAAHYFKLPLGTFDVANVTVSRIGPNLTYSDANGHVYTHGHGLLGTVVRRRASEGCPECVQRPSAQSHRTHRERRPRGLLHRRRRLWRVLRRSPCE